MHPGSAFTLSSMATMSEWPSAAAAIIGVEPCFASGILMASDALGSLNLASTASASPSVHALCRSQYAPSLTSRLASSKWPAFSAWPTAVTWLSSVSVVLAFCSINHEAKSARPRAAARIKGVMPAKSATSISGGESSSAWAAYSIEPPASIAPYSYTPSASHAHNRAFAPPRSRVATCAPCSRRKETTSAWP